MNWTVKPGPSLSNCLQSMLLILHEDDEGYMKDQTNLSVCHSAFDRMPAFTMLCFNLRYHIYFCHFYDPAH